MSGVEYFCDVRIPINIKYFRRTSQKVKREETNESTKKEDKVDKKEKSWLRKPGKPIIKK